MLADRRSGTRLRAGAASDVRLAADGKLVVAREIADQGRRRLLMTIYGLSLDRGRLTSQLSCTQRTVPTRGRSAQRVLKDVAPTFARTAFGTSSDDGAACGAVG